LRLTKSSVFPHNPKRRIPEGSLTKRRDGHTI
jgi:hypothetical protein